MKKENIKNIMVVFCDNDFVRVFDWIGKVTLNTITSNNICDCAVLEESTDIENFIKSLLPTAIEFIQYRQDKYAEFCRYKDITKDEITNLVNYFNDIEFVYNFSEDPIYGHSYYIEGESEILIIDLVNHKSYIR
jgi:hypothetical protein